jgi:2'-5' RNA ligase
VKSGIIIISELHGDLRDQVLEVQRRFDPKLAKTQAPHVTITGSSGMGPFPARTSKEALRGALEPIAQATEPMSLTFLPPMRFMQSNVVVLPLDPNGPLRALHERIKKSGLRYEPARFTYTPHVTLSFFRELSHADEKALLSLRIKGPVLVDHIAAHKTVGLVNTTEVLRLPLGANPA